MNVNDTDNRRPWAVPAAVAATVGILLSAALIVASKRYASEEVWTDEQFKPLVGKLAPYFERASVAHGTVSNEDFSGEPYVLFFGDPGCSACDLMYHVLQEADQKLDILYIGAGDSLRLVEKTDSLGFRFPIVYDPANELRELFGVDATPTSLVIGADGRVESGAAGSISAGRVVEKLHSEKQMKEGLIWNLLNRDSGGRG